MDAQRSTAIGGPESERPGGTRSGNNIELPAIALGMRNGDECFSESGTKCGFASTQAAFALAGSQHQTCCGGSTAGRPLDCRGSHVPSGNAKCKRRDADAQRIAKSADFCRGYRKSARLSCGL